VCFGSDYTGPWNDMLGFIPLRIEHQGAELIIDVEDAERLDERCLKILGGGRIAEVRTVVQTLP
jgi:hypothetical protein